MTERLNSEALEAAAKELFLEDANAAYVKYPEWDSPENVGKPVYIENARAAVSAYLAALPQDTIDLKAAGEAAVLDGEFYERTEWNNLSFEVQEQYLNSSRLTILNYLSAHRHK